MRKVKGQNYIPVSHDMMRQTNDCSPVRVMQHKVMYFLYLSQKILVKINLPGQKSHPSERVTFLTGTGDFFDQLSSQKSHPCGLLF